eukprot:5790329-Pleurochrysis_carterae.AAC.1
MNEKLGSCLRHTYVTLPSPVSCNPEAPKGVTRWREKEQGVRAPTASNDAVFSGSAADLHLRYLSLSQTEAAGRPGWYSSRGEPRAERPSRADVRGAEEPSAPASLSASTSDRSVADWSPVDDELAPTPIVSDGREPLPSDSTCWGKES